MRLSTLLVVGTLVLGGLYVARNADDWMNRLHREKEHVTAALKKRAQDEQTKLADAAKRRLNSAEAQARIALKKRLDREEAQARTTLKKRLARERAAAARGAAGLQTTLTTAAAGRSEIETAATGMAESTFWDLISQTRSAAGNDTGRQSGLLKDRLTQLSPRAIIGFARIRDRLEERANTWNLWGAAHVIEDGCSDDCFENFRGYLISLGQGPYEAALSNPDSLASVAQDAETGGWENAEDVAPDAYSSVTGNDFPLDDSDLSSPPRGTPFDENDTAGLARRYPRLAARFR